MLKQVLINLLNNAAKYTRGASPASIEVSCETRGGEHVIKVRDNGIGFSMEYADRVFGVFQRLHRSEEFEGAGIGLSTVKRIISRHGGRVWAESEPGKGATFYFTLPAK
jgi:signal transduction histidine kinase